MTVAKKTVLDAAIAQLQKKYGRLALQWLADVPQPSYLTTGMMELDDILGGGLPLGRIVEVFGLKQSGKTALAAQLVSQASTLCWIDAEHKMTPDFARVLHLPDETLVVQPESLEHALEVVREMLTLGFQAVVIDSLPALPASREGEEKDFTKNTGFSQTAGLLSRKLPTVLHLLAEQQAILLVINQQRANVNAVAFGEQYHTFGGLALANYASLRLASARKAWLKHDKLGVYGMEVAVLVDKTNTGIPRQGVALPLVYDVGMISTDQLPETRKVLLAAGKQRALPPGGMVLSNEPIDIVHVQEVMRQHTSQGSQEDADTHPNL